MPNTASNKVGDERDNAEWEIAALLCGEYIPLFALGKSSHYIKYCALPITPDFFHFVPLGGGSS